MAKKIFVFSLILSVLFVVYTPSALGAPGGPTFAAGSLIAAERGGSVSVPVTVSGNPGFAAVSLVVTYDPAVVEVTGVTAPAAGMSINSHFALTTTPGAQWISLVNDAGEDWSGNGTVVNIIFYVLPTAPVGLSYIGLTFTSMPDGTPGNSAGDILTGSTTVSGSINVAQPYSGGYVSPPPSTISGSGEETGVSNSGHDDTGAAGDGPIAEDADTDIHGDGHDEAVVVLGTGSVYDDSLSDDDGIVSDNDVDSGLADDSDVDASSNSFIGSAQVPDDFDVVVVGNDVDSSFDGQTGLVSLSYTGANQGYGKVPQTGVADVAVLEIALAVGLLAAVILWARVARGRKDDSDGR